jgi:PPOX class probable F420-dependent enzyme
MWQMSISTLDRISAGAPAEAPFAALRGRQFIKLTTYRKTGKPVPTTVWFVEENGCLYITTAADSGKVKRLRHTPQVRVTACAPWGAPLGPELSALARVLVPDEYAHALAALRRKYGWLFWVFERCDRTEQTYLEVSPA